MCQCVPRLCALVCVSPRVWIRKEGVHTARWRWQYGNVPVCVCMCLQNRFFRIVTRQGPRYEHGVNNFEAKTDREKDKWRQMKLADVRRNRANGLITEAASF